ncbi:hypothetical protein A3C96_00485 [Candidatus Uhrbacteria bacterium RIFCSPHIGHO2_02_FULL_60_10]|uniref:Uncharacterized protein n=1 Tax=Candidatus Uhrbacteria bacterium RIFCSPHIGHO2_02_FULL_60_10 TaxID=1802392 RepID=A0A1F7U8E0_9BACT|nr:MAG: hypothetical protein A3C96_00485 [Candidatus Uhrbacteria bacterium RIFCSPHIGHO2_02_FULL_60_10]
MHEAGLTPAQTARLTRDCLGYAKKRSPIVAREQSAVHRAERWDMTDGDLRILFWGYDNMYGNSSCCLEVQQERQTVFEANGDFIQGEMTNIVTSKFVRGRWLKIIAGEVKP